jgi:tRNA A-37 threonylcarbamoyl transferase component Bud32
MPEVLKRVGRFDLLEVIGRGGAAVVYLAVQRDLQRNVALKELAPYHLADSSFAQRFVEESRLAGAMNHPSVVTVHEYFEDGSVPYIAMEYLPYGSLRHYVGRLSLAQVAGVLEAVLAGLSHGEAHGIVHRDLKPENLLVSFDGRVKIADFGVARAYSKAATRAVVTVTGTTIGTPAYMSPEQALGGDLTPATDLYSLGVVTWELLAGRVPFEQRDTPVAVLFRHVHEPVPSVTTVAPDVDERISSWLDQMLAKRPEDRFQSAEAAWVELEDIVIELLGPRWRREARLVLDDAPAPADPPAISETMTGHAQEAPAPFVTPAEPAPPDEPAQEPTVAPAARPQPGNTTMLRVARRHRDSTEATGPLPPETVRRRLIALAIVAAMVVAAIGGVVLAGSGTSHHSPSKAQRAAALRAAAAAQAKAAESKATDKQLVAIVQRLAVARTRALTRLLNDKTPSDQTTDANAVRGDYTAAAGKVAPLAAKSPAAAPLHATLSATAADYGRLVAAGRSGSQQRWDSARTAIKADEKRLQGDVAKL